MKNHLINLCFAFATMLLLSGCGNDDADPSIVNQEELITTIRLNFSEGDNTFSAEWKDLDGDGAMAPVVDDIGLESGKTYNVVVEILNESKTPAEDITDEIEEEAEEHQFFFSVANGVDLNIQYNDEDGNGNPVGLRNIFTAEEPGTGTLTVILKHEPDKTAEGVSAGDPTNSGGETDIETTPSFNISIQ